MAIKKNQVLVPDHIYVPKHEIIPKAEAEEVLKKYNCKPTELPLIFVNDPAIMGLGVKPGDMIKITRKSPTAGESLYYRYCGGGLDLVHPSNKRWPVIQDILKREGIAKQHLNSFDEFLVRGLQSIINEVGQIDIENAEYPYKIQLGKVKLQQPRMMELDGSITHITPAEARLRNVSYAAPVMMEASVIEDGKILESRFVHIGDVPVMAKSNACILNNFSNSKLIDYGEDPNDPWWLFYH